MDATAFAWAFLASMVAVAFADTSTHGATTCGKTFWN